MTSVVAQGPSNATAVRFFSQLNVAVAQYLRHPFLFRVQPPNIVRCPKKQERGTSTRKSQSSKKSEIHRQAAIPPCDDAYLAISYRIKLQIMEKNPSDDCQKSVLSACSLVRYHIPVMSKKPAEMLLSSTPCNARRAMSEDQFCTALMQMRQIPQPVI